MGPAGGRVGPLERLDRRPKLAAPLPRVPFGKGRFPNLLSVASGNVEGMDEPPPYPVPQAEDERVWELRRYGILDSEPEQAYDDLVEVAAKLYDTAFAQLGFIEEERQWFKSRLGLEGREIPRGAGFCAWTIMETDGVTVVEDARENPRYEEVPIVSGDPGVRFYAGAPIVGDDGHALGTICVLDTEPRSLGEGGGEPLEALSRTAFRLLQLRRASQDLAFRKDELERYAEGAAERLRDPLSALTSHLDLVEGALDGEGEDPREHLAVARESTRAMERISTLLREYAHLGQGEAAQREDVDLDAVMDEVREALADPLEAADGRLEVGALPTVRGNPRQIRQLLLNLVDNAVRYAGGAPQVEVSAERLDGTWRVEVADEGRGIPEEEQDRIFEVFYRGKSSRGTEGSGLGLALAKRVVELHGEDIRVDSAWGEGATFSFTLPAAGG